MPTPSLPALASLLAPLFLCACASSASSSLRPPLVDYRASDEVEVTFKGDWGRRANTLQTLSARLESNLEELGPAFAERGVRPPLFRLRLGEEERLVGASPGGGRVTRVELRLEREREPVERFLDVDEIQHFGYTSERRTRKVTAGTVLRLRVRFEDATGTRSHELIESGSLYAHDDVPEGQPLSPRLRDEIQRVNALPRLELLRWVGEALTYCSPKLGAQRPEGPRWSRLWLVRRVLDERTFVADLGWRQLELHSAEPGQITAAHVGCFVELSFADRAPRGIRVEERAEDLGL